MGGSGWVGFGQVGKEDLGFGVVAGMSGEDGVMTTGMGAEDEFGFWAGLEAEALGADGDAAIVADLDGGALAPDEGPPRAAGHGAQHGAFFLFGGVPGLLGFPLEFAVDFVLVAMETQGLHLRVGVCEVGDVFAGEEGGEAVLPELVFAFDLALGLRRGGVAERDAVEVEGRAELGERFGNAGEEEGMEVHIEFERETVFEKGVGEEVEIGREVFVLVELGSGEEAAAIVEHVEHGKSVFDAGKPAVGRGIQLPEFADFGTLPAADGSVRFCVGLGLGELVFDGPAADLGAVEGEVAEAADFTGREAVVGGWI